MAEDAPGRSRAAGWHRCRVLFYLLLALVVVDSAVGRQRKRWRAYDPDDYRERVRACRRRAWDLVVVGGSPVCEGIDPGLLAGVRWHGQALEQVYNLGLPGATTSEVWHSIEHGLGRRPRLLVYGITATDLNDSRDERHGPRTLMDAGDLPLWFRYRPEARAWCLRNFAQQRLERLWSLFYFRNGIRLWAADEVERLWPGTFPEAAAEAREGLRYSAALHQEHGFAPRSSHQAERLDYAKTLGALRPQFPFLNAYHLGGHLAYLHHLLDWAANNAVAVVLVDMPVSADLEERLYPQEFATYRAALAEVERSRGVPVLHATRAAVVLTDADFADLIHLNAWGTARLSRWLRSAIRGLETVGGSMAAAGAPDGRAR